MARVRCVYCGRALKGAGAERVPPSCSLHADLNARDPSTDAAITAELSEQQRRLAAGEHEAYRHNPDRKG